MQDQVANPEWVLQQEIAKEISKRTFYISMDYKLAHVFLWASIIASFSSTIIISSESPINKIWLAIIAGIPGLVILIDKTFDFPARATWGMLFKIELERLQDELVFHQIEGYEAAKKLREIIERQEMLYARIGFFSRRPSDPISGTSTQVAP